MTEALLFHLNTEIAFDKFLISGTYHKGRSEVLTDNRVKVLFLNQPLIGLSYAMNPQPLVRLTQTKSQTLS